MDFRNIFKIIFRNNLLVLWMKWINLIKKYMQLLHLYNTYISIYKFTLHFSKGQF